MVYPYYKELQNFVPTMNDGNFGLWYNKFIPIKDFDSCKTSDDRGNENNAVSYYYEKYNRMQKDTISELLNKKHQDQVDVCAALSSRYESIVFKAQLEGPLITGIGETHPHEISMVFDYNLGIPYIPASGIKGIVRFAHTLELLFDENGTFTDKFVEEENGHEIINEENNLTFIPQLFGSQTAKGSVIFLDAYSEKVPELHIDIMNPHYSDYYGDDTYRTPPADYLNPVPLKFLTVAKDTVFIFRALVDNKIAGLVDKVKTAFKKALTEEGVGSKTAVGYGTFEICDSEDTKVTEKMTPQKEEPKPIDKFISAIKILNPSDAGPIGSIIDQALKILETDAEKRQFALAVKEHMGKGFKKSKAKNKLERFL